jgi:hypothetical protein
MPGSVGGGFGGEVLGDGRSGAVDVQALALVIVVSIETH